MLTTQIMVSKQIHEKRGQPIKASDLDIFGYVFHFCQTWIAGWSCALHRQKAVTAY